MLQWYNQYYFSTFSRPFNKTEAKCSRQRLKFFLEVSLASRPALTSLLFAQCFMKGQSGSGWVELEVWKAHKIICCRQSAVEVKSFYSNHLEDILLDGRHDPGQPISLRSTNVHVPLLDQNPGDAWKRFLFEMVDKTLLVSCDYTLLIIMFITATKVVLYLSLSGITWKNYPWIFLESRMCD